jgi:Tol biopolymer transport system component
MKKKTVVIIAVAGGLLLVLCGGAFIAFKIFMGKIINKVNNMTVFIENVSTGTVEKISSGGNNLFPTFSPDGTQLLYKHSSNGCDVLMVYTIANHVSKPITADCGSYLSPVWCPRDNSIFCIVQKNGIRDIQKMAPDDGSTENVTRDSISEYDVNISPDGKWLLFTQRSDNNRDELFIVPSEGGTKMQLTRSGDVLHEIKCPVWSSNSEEIALISFLKMQVITIEGKLLKEVDLTGLYNFMDLLYLPGSNDTLLMKARPSDESLKFNIYKIALSTGKIEVWKTRRPMLEMGYGLSPDRKCLVYSR